jgi:hypothetical protein
MSNESQIIAKDYIKNMVEPQAAFTESYFEENQMIIKCENDSYTIPSFKMLAMKVVGNNIFCDDMKSVSIINTNTMEKTKIINNRNGNTFLYSIYHDE